MIAQSPITGISKEQKIEVVSTLVAYPLVLNELELTNQLLESSRELVKALETQLQLKEQQILLLENSNDLSNRQIQLLQEQLKIHKKSNWELPLTIGIVIGLVGGILL